MKIQWVGDDNAESYVIERRKGPNGSWERISPKGLTGEQFMDANVEPSADYTYRIIAKNSVGESEPSEVSVSLTIKIKAEEDKVEGKKEKKKKDEGKEEEEVQKTKKAEKSKQRAGETKEEAVAAKAAEKIAPPILQTEEPQVNVPLGKQTELSVKASPFCLQILVGGTVVREYLTLST